MDWTDEAIVLSSRPHGETAAIAVLLTRERGRHAGLVHGGQGKRGRATLEPGGLVQAQWRARLADQLGTFGLEPLRNHAAALLDEPLRLAAMSSACALVEAAMPEREPHPGLFEATSILLELLSTDVWAEAYVRWEVGLLEETGFGLDLSQCAATGSNDLLAYVSPRTGRAVSLSAGEPFREKLLPLPGFLIGRDDRAPEALVQGLALTGHFLERGLFAAHHMEMPAARVRLADMMRRLAGAATKRTEDERGVRA